MEPEAVRRSFYSRQPESHPEKWTIDNKCWEFGVTDFTISQTQQQGSFFHDWWMIWKHWQTKKKTFAKKKKTWQESRPFKLFETPEDKKINLIKLKKLKKTSENHKFRISSRFLFFLLMLVDSVENKRGEELITIRKITKWAARSISPSSKMKHWRNKNNIMQCNAINASFLLQ